MRYAGSSSRAASIGSGVLSPSSTITNSSLPCSGAHAAASAASPACPDRRGSTAPRRSCRPTDRAGAAIGLPFLDQRSRRARTRAPASTARAAIPAGLRPDISRDRRCGPPRPATAPPAAPPASRPTTSSESGSDARSTMYGIWRSAASTTRRSANPRAAPALCASTPASRPSATRPALPAGTVRMYLNSAGIERRADRRQRRRGAGGILVGGARARLAPARVGDRLDADLAARRFEVVARRASVALP